MPPPKQAPVQPRAFREGNYPVLPLEDEVAPLVAGGARGTIAILGPAGSGKTTALQHLAAVLPNAEHVRFLDEPSARELREARPDRLVIYSARSVRLATPLATFWLAPWEEDDLIEYLLAVHRPRCAAVMARLRPADRALFGGVPGLWRVVLDRLAADESLPDARAALHRHLEEHLSDTDLLGRARSACLNAVIVADADLSRALEQLAKPGLAESLSRTLRHPAAQLLLASERMAADLHGEWDADFLALRLPRDLVRTAATLIAEDARAKETLLRLLTGPPWSHAMSASLLHAAEIGWVPQPGSTPCLRGAYLEEAAWPGVQLEGANLEGADLSAAYLPRANLTGANARKAVLRQARLHGAALGSLDAANADLSGADLSGVQAVAAVLDVANLEGANLQGAMLHRALLRGTNLTGANLRDADLAEADLLWAGIQGADFTGANLLGAHLSGLCLREAIWDGACFAGARMVRCDLEGLALPGAVFEGAFLKSALLTGSTMPGANFRKARLCNAGLADVDWECADLRGADLRGASFHLGSTRSGLVGSPIACEGSRTGFYTDDFEEQTFKAPEEIRKANLSGANLRGARLDGVDFYLVDLRGARYDPEQEEQFRCTGAILEARA
jgi:uncharacterized protein YjbI with pentapeptide repeats/energy-coupling factor transporter ATP-binding protein EcfA2